MNTEIIQYLRGEGNHKIGIMLAKLDGDKVRISWSKCNKKDQFDIRRGLNIASGKLINGSKKNIPSTKKYIEIDNGDIMVNEDGQLYVPVKTLIPSLKEQYETFVSRTTRYFKTVNLNNFVLCCGSENEKKRIIENVVNTAR